MTPLFKLKLSNAQVMFNKFDPFNLNNGVDVNRVKMLKYMLKLGIE